MDYSNFSIKNFCDIIYCDSRTMHNSSDISSVDMYSFIKHKTDNFNLNSFEYFIQDLRDYYKHVEICLKNPDLEPEIENNPHLDFRLSYINFELGNVKFIVTYCPVLKIDEKLTLIERIELHKNLISGSFIDHNYSKLKKFSDIAEKQYISVLNNTINEKELEMLKLHKSLISFNKPLDELSSDEFVNKCYFDYVSILDAYNYIKFKTANFNKHEMELFFREFLVHITCFYFTIKVDTQIKTFTLSDYFSSDLFENKLSNPEILKKGFAHKHDYIDPETGLYYLIVGINTLNSLVEYISDIEEDLNFEHNIQTLLELENKLVYEYEIRYGSFQNFLNSITETDNNLLKITDISTLDNNHVILNPFLPTIWKTKTDIINAHAKLKNSLIKCDIDTWLYWFGNIPVDNPKKIKWIFKEGNKRALTYFVEKISLSKSIDFAKTRKIFDVQVYNKDKFKFSFGEIDDLLS